MAQAASSEGPFGDRTGYYTLPEPYPVFHATALRGGTRDPRVRFGDSPNTAGEWHRDKTSWTN